ncbi:hypothetical protein Hanom_Chr14g01290361 [Helianthus anomalus]
MEYWCYFIYSLHRSDSLEARICGQRVCFLYWILVTLSSRTISVFILFPHFSKILMNFFIL